MLSPEFLPFIQGAPCAVMTRLAAEWLLDEATVNELFDAHAVEQYQREITLSNVVNVMLDVNVVRVRREGRFHGSFRGDCSLPQCLLRQVAKNGDLIRRSHYRAYGQASTSTDSETGW
ncbi:MAG: hypothetical protein U0894_11825 [Pirellulales bacterium]